MKVKTISLTHHSFIIALHRIDIGAYKEAVNQLSLAIAHGKEHKNKPLWLSLLGYTKYLYGYDEAILYHFIQSM